jgi:fructose-bisphosphate aldolase class I
MDHAELEQVAAQIVAPGKGLLAADESTPTIGKRFAAVSVESTPENRRGYRELLLTAPGLAEHISGVILFDETLRQSTSGGVPFAEVLQQAGILPGIKVDRGTTALPGFAGETATAGLDGLRERFAEYRELGARFAKWRAVIRVGPGLPTSVAVRANAHGLARYAALAQEAGLVPVVEPEVLMDGDHPIDRCAEVTEAVLEAVYAELFAHRVHLEGTVLKPNMVIPGQDASHGADPRQVAEETLRVMRRRVPAAVPGLVFLSGGQSESEATLHLSLMNRIGGVPWQLSFSYGRALQQSVLRTWAGRSDRTGAAQRALLHRAHLNGLARDGQYEPRHEAA